MDNKTLTTVIFTALTIIAVATGHHPLIEGNNNFSPRVIIYK